MRTLPLSYAVRNLGRSSSRLLLSIGGATLVVLLVLAAGAFIRGMSESLRGTSIGDNVLILGTGSEESLERSEIPASTASLLAASVRGLRESAGTTFISPEVHVQLPISIEQSIEPGRLMLVRGITPAALLVHAQTQIIDGEFPRAGEAEILIGTLAFRKLGVPETSLVVGSTLFVENKPWTIAGILAAPNSLIEGELWMNLTDLKTLTRRETDSCISASLSHHEGAAELADIQSFCQPRLDLEISATTEASYYGKLSQFFAPIRIAAWATAILMALGGLFGGLNTMYAAFGSRVRELGMLQCLGYSRFAVIGSLVQESCLISLSGANHRERTRPLPPRRPRSRILVRCVRTPGRPSRHPPLTRLRPPPRPHRSPATRPSHPLTPHPRISQIRRHVIRDTPQYLYLFTSGELTMNRSLVTITSLVLLVAAVGCEKQSTTATALLPTPQNITPSSSPQASSSPKPPPTPSQSKTPSPPQKSATPSPSSAESAAAKILRQRTSRLHHR